MILQIIKWEENNLPSVCLIIVKLNRTITIHEKSISNLEILNDDSLELFKII